MRALIIPPLAASDARGWAQYAEPILITPDDAAELRPGQDTPEAVTAGFYAALMRGDPDVSELCIKEEATGRVDDKLAELRTWRVHRVELRARRLRGTQRCTIRLHFDVEANGRRHSGEDQIELRRDDEGRWRVSRPPT